MSVVAAVLIARYLPRTEFGRRVILAPDGPPGSLGLTGSGSAVTDVLSALPGRRGLAVTDLRPAGRIEIDGEPFDAVTQGDFIERIRPSVSEMSIFSIYPPQQTDVLSYPPSDGLPNV